MLPEGHFSRICVKFLVTVSKILQSPTTSVKTQPNLLDLAFAVLVLSNDASHPSNPDKHLTLAASVLVLGQNLMSISLIANRKNP